MSDNNESKPYDATKCGKPATFIGCLIMTGLFLLEMAAFAQIVKFW